MTRIERLTKITPQQMEDYIARRITSIELSKLSGYAAPYIRRAIPRPPATNMDKLWRAERRALKEARQRMHASVAHLTIEQIMVKANVSRSTAMRIKRRNGK